MEKAKSKIEIFKNLIKDAEVICPICREKLFVNDNSLKCNNNHTFNINKKGYVSLLKTQKKFSEKIYNKQLFDSRRTVILSSIYDELHKEISDTLNKIAKDKITIVEIGSGESTHSCKIKNQIKVANNYIVTDLSKVGMEMSTDYLSQGLLPIMCDAYNMPIESNSTDVIIDILSPYCYKEVNRILKDDGLIIKVCPNNSYLKEIRDSLQIQDYQKQDEVLENFKSNFSIVDIKNIKKNHRIDSMLSENLFSMTPMTNNHVYEQQINNITIDLSIIIAKKKKQ